MKRDEWLERVARAVGARLHPFDGRRAQELAAFCMDLYRVANYRTHRVMLPAVRKIHGERMTRRYVAVLTEAGFIRMAVKPARGQLGGDGRAAEYALTAPVEADNAAPDPAANGAANATPKRGSVVRDDDPDDRGRSRTTVPTAEHGTDAPLVNDARSARTSKRTGRVVVLRISDPMLGNIRHRLAPLVRVA